MKGASNMRAKLPDTRLPITLAILKQILHNSNKTITLFSHRIMFTAMCLLAFHAFLRTGEICSKTNTLVDSSNIIQRQDVKLINSCDKVIGVELILRKFKHSTRPVILFVPSYDKDLSICPVRALQIYFNHSFHNNGPLFQMLDGKPVSYAFFNTKLKAH